MKMQFLLYSLFFSNIVCDSQLQAPSNIQEQIGQLQSLKQRLSQIKPNHQLFDQLQQYGRYAGQLASTVVSLTSQKIEQKQKSGGHGSKFSAQDSNNIIQIVTTAFVLITEFARYCHEKRLQKKVVQTMTYQDFVMLYPQLVILEYQIMLCAHLIELSKSGTQLEQIFARISLTGMTLPKPYEKYMNKQAKKMYKMFFNEKQQFVYKKIKDGKYPYKKFAKKVAQDWKVLMYKYIKSATDLCADYQSVYKSMIDNDYNQTLLQLIDHIGKHDFATVVNLSQKYEHDPLIKELMIKYVQKK